MVGIYRIDCWYSPLFFEYDLNKNECKKLFFSGFLFLSLSFFFSEEYMIYATKSVNTVVCKSFMNYANRRKLKAIIFERQTDSFFSSSILEISLNLIKVITLDSYNDGSCAMSIPRKLLITAITYARIRRRLRERAR